MMMMMILMMIENTIRNGNFDVVVIQDQSQRPSFGMSYV